MNIRAMSDLHIEFFNFQPVDVPADVIVLAGDIYTKHRGLRWARNAFGDRPLVYVMGNHEYYHAHYEDVLCRAREAAAELGVHLLEKDQVIIQGVRFLGTTLWTDFAVEAPRLSRSLALRYADASMTDFRIIRYQHRRFTRRIRVSYTRNPALGSLRGWPSPSPARPSS